MKIKAMFMLAICLLLLTAAQPFKSGYGVGDRVADFKLKSTDGKMVSLTDYKNAKGVIVIFDCNTCPYSKAYNERIISLNNRYAEKGFPVIAINANDPEKSPGDSFDEMVQHAKSNSYKFPYLFDETQAVARAFGATNTPHVFILEKTADDFKIVYIGAIDNNVRDANAADKKYVQQAIDALLEGKEIPATKTKAVGCGIKWKAA
jgi:peroxiredoxin